MEFYKNSHRDSSVNGSHDSANGTHSSEPHLQNSYEELSFATKQVYESYLELLNYKAKNLLLAQFFRDIYTQAALGFIFLAIFFTSGAIIWTLSDRISPVLMAVALSLVFLAFAGFYIWKGFFNSKDKAESREDYVDEELQRIHSLMARETQNLSGALSGKESHLMDQINPVEIVSQKVKEHPSLSVGAVLLAGLYTAYRTTSSKD